MENMEQEPIRIAQVIGKWVGGGVEAVVMNYYRHIDKSKIQFDFICDEDSTNIPYEEIEKLGGKVILIPPYQKLFRYHKELKRILKEGNYKMYVKSSKIKSNVVEFSITSGSYVEFTCRPNHKGNILSLIICKLFKGNIGINITLKQDIYL